MRFLKKIFFILLFLLFFLFSCIYFLFCTNYGAKLACNFLIPEIEIASISGNLYNCVLRGIFYKTNCIIINIEDVYLSLDIHSLFLGNICINKCVFNNVNLLINDVQLNTNYIKKNIFVNFVQLFNVVLKNIKLNSVVINWNGCICKINNISSRLDVNKNFFTFSKTLVQGVEIFGNFFKNNQKSSQNSNNSLFFINILHDSCCHLLYKLSNFNMPIQVSLMETKIRDFKIIAFNINYLINDLNISVLINERCIKIILLEILSLHGELNITGTLALFDKCFTNFKGNVIINLPFCSSERINFNIKGYLLDELSVTCSFCGPYEAELIFKIQLTSDTLPLCLVLNSKRLQFSLFNGLEVLLNNFTLKVNSKIFNNSLSIKLIFDNSDYVLPNLNIFTKKNDDVLSFLKSGLFEIYGFFCMNIVLNYDNVIDVSSELVFKHFNFFTKNCGSFIDFFGKMDIRGIFIKHESKLLLSLLDIDGDFNNRVFKIRSLSDVERVDTYKVPVIFFIMGKNYLKFVSNDKDDCFLNVSIFIPLINEILPSLDGVMYGSVKLIGSLHNLCIVANVSASNLSCFAKRLYIDNLLLKTDIKVCDKLLYSDLMLSINKFVYFEFSINKLVCNITGDIKTHVFRLTVDDKLFSLNLKFRGIFDPINKIWISSINDFSFITPFSKILLIENILLKYDYIKNMLFINSKCMFNCNVQYFLSDTLNNNCINNYKINFDIFNTFISKLSLYLANMQLDDSIVCCVDIHWDIGINNVQGMIFLCSKECKITHKFNNKDISIYPNVYVIKIFLNNKKLYFNWFIDFLGHGEFYGKLSLDFLSKKTSCYGYICIKNFSLSFVKFFLQPEFNIRGRCNLCLKIDGCLKQPKIYGRLYLSDLFVGCSLLPYNVTDSRLFFIFSGNSVVLDGLLITNCGKIYVTGNGYWSSIESIFLRMKFQSEQLRIFYSQMTQLIFSPDIIFELKDFSLSCYGNISVPLGCICIKYLPQDVVQISSDEVLLDNTLKFIPNKIRDFISYININLLVRIGDDVNVDAFGFKAKINGYLNIIQCRQKFFLTGNIIIPSGHFNFYGQNLLINKGECFFSEFFDYPYINIEAVKNPDMIYGDIVVGLKVSGFIDKLKLEIFSDPMKSNKEILSYLIHGHGLNIFSKESDFFASMLFGIGFSHGEKLLDRFGKIFGINNLCLDTCLIGDKYQFILRGYILPKLQFKYSIGSFNLLETLTLQYNLFSQLYLEATSGSHQSFDLLYRLHF